jgi:hypothetical protein
MGVKAVFAPLRSHLLCFGGRGDQNRPAYFSLPEKAARLAVERPFVITIGGGKSVEPGVAGHVVNLARVSTVYGLTEKMVESEEEKQKLAQWPVAVALQEVWQFNDLPHLVNDLGFPDRLILAGSQDQIIYPKGHMDQLWSSLQASTLRPVALPLLANFHVSGTLTKVSTRLPMSVSAEEGEKLYKLQRVFERDRRLSKAAKGLSKSKYGKVTCEACKFSHEDAAMFDAHHPAPLSAGIRTTFPEHLVVLCPTCHRRAHRKGLLDPYSVAELIIWCDGGRR